MKSSFEKLEENKIKLTIEVPPEALDEEIEKAYTKISKEIDVPGFRKGKVPKEIIDTKVGPSAIDQEAIRDAIPNYYVKAVSDNELQPVDVPNVDIQQGERGKPLIFTAEVFVKPEPKLGEYDGIEVEQLITQVTDEEIDANIDKIRERYAVMETLEDDRPIENGDFVVIDFKGYIDDVAFEGGSMDDYTLLIGSGSFIDTFEDQLVGKKKGEHAIVNVTFPADYQAENLAGKLARFEVDIKEIKVKKLPEMTNELAKEASAHETVEQLRAEMKDQFEQMYKAQAENEMKARLLKIVTDNAEFSIPDAMTENELDYQIQDFSRMLARQGVPMEKYFEMTGKSEPQLREQFRDEAFKTVKVRLVLEAIAKTVSIEVNDEDIDAQMEKYAAETELTPQELKERIINAGNMHQIIEDITRFKTINWLAEHAKIKLVDKFTPIEDSSEQVAEEAEPSEAPGTDESDAVEE